jgi:phage I-like protein
MSKRKNFFANVALSEGEDGSPKKNYQILKAGEFIHTSTGERVKITKADLKAIVANFDKGVRGIDVAVNYEHGRSAAHGTKASGWFSSLTLEAEGEELWAAIEWTPQASEELKNREWRYFSPELSFDYLDNMNGTKHGAALTGGALTNVPVIKGMTPLAASENQHEMETKTMNLAELTEKLAGLGISLSELQAKAAKADTLATQLSEAKGLVASTEQKLSEANAKVTELSEKVTASEKASAKVKFDALVEKGMRDGKLTKAFSEGPLKEVFEKNGFEFAETMVNAMPKVMTTDSKGHGGGAQGDSGKPADVELSEKASELAAKDNISISDAVARVRRAEPELAKRYDSMHA